MEFLRTTTGPILRFSPSHAPVPRPPRHSLKPPARRISSPAPTPSPATPPKARTAYHDFSALSKDADPDIPILKEAKAEYEKLQTKLLGRVFWYPRSRFCLKTAPTHWHQEGVRWSFLPLRSTSE